MKLFFSPLTGNVNKCGGSCNTIDGQYAQFYVPKKVRNMNVKAFNLMSRVNQTRLLVQHE